MNSPNAQRPTHNGAPTAPIGYLLHLADNALVFGQRNAEWCGHGPVLEEDLALANHALDHMGQARLLYQHAATCINADPALTKAFDHLQGARGDGQVSEDTLAYFRSAHEFHNYTLLELPHHGPLAGPARADRDYATTIVRNFLYAALMNLWWTRLQDSADTQLAGIAAKSLKEVRYHLRHAGDWLVRFGDGTAESHARAQAALHHLMPYTQEFWTGSDAEAAAVANGTGVALSELKPAWDALVDEALAEATLQRPKDSGYVSQGKRGVHSEHMGFLLAEMQSLAREHPTATW
ncbi:MAG: phenylacetate-CoA oxygenase subunit PaaC [Hydrogenophaga sp.]|uniref:1,2-phenylacetyl-CoA epoxidase subunit PaaC n=1 Tax=Hydrogenophaga sp. TaxID=1904254 RepID=UPI001E1620FF|nr:1,2-phenylacetyl-CoA epoxidase subunit PaaC [Hydrogenophaga sp.]MBX3611182.1 phenylacetate-CoA oxygenase subunit PaaC [Hydrogenophaga sp.]